MGGHDDKSVAEEHKNVLVPEGRLDEAPRVLDDVEEGRDRI